MRTRTKWMVAGGAAAVVLAPIAAVYGSTPLDGDLQHAGVVIDGEAVNQARAARTTAERAQAGPTVPASPTDAAASPSDEPTTTSSPKATKKAKAKATTEPSGKKTVSAASPVSQHTPVSPVSPNTPN